MKAIIAVINKKGEDATQTAVAMLKALGSENTEIFGIASPNTLKQAETIEELQQENLHSPIVIGCAFSKILSIDKPQLIKICGASLVFDGRLYLTKKKGLHMGVVIQKLNQKETLKNLFKSGGFFAFAMASPDAIIGGRDAMGVHPFYYGENLKLATLSSVRKSLWKIGIKNPASFPPGHIALVDSDGFQFKHMKTLTYFKPKQMTMKTAAKYLQKLLQHSIKEHVSKLHEVAMAFSGGVDSSLIAFLSKNARVNVHLIHVSLRGQSETEHAKKVAEALKLPIYTYIYDEKDVLKVLDRVLWLIEEPNAVKTSIGIPFYWTVEKTAQMNLKVLLAGQGADELFGGYKRYVNSYLVHGVEKTHKMLFKDVVKMCESNFERDFKICIFNNVELRLPFANYDIANFASRLPVELKVKLPDDGLRKLVLRQVAENVGLPKFVVERPKRAIQYATGVNKVLKRIADKEGLTLKEYLHQKFQILLKKMMIDG